MRQGLRLATLDEGLGARVNPGPALGLLPSRGYEYPPIGADQYVQSPTYEDLEAHRERCGERPSAAGRSAEILLGILDEVGLTGCGGGHFPVARKWRTALRAGGGGIVVANAAESEPASAKDRALLAAAPHLVLDGIACAAEVLGATETIIWMHEDAVDARRAVSAAIVERRAAGLAEHTVRLELAPDRYLSGESSAVLSALAGGAALPAFSRHPSAWNGHRGSPAVVHNVETLARIGLLSRTGVRAYRPTTLVTVCTSAARTVFEVTRQASIGDVVARGAVTQAPQAVLVGGYGGSWLTWEVAVETSVDEAAARQVGASLGAGVLIPLAHSECGLARTADIAEFMAAAGAGQCGPCRFGLPALAARLRSLAEGNVRKDELQQLSKLAALIDGRGGCKHPDGVVRMVASAMHTFAADADRHVRGLPCLAHLSTHSKGA